MVLHGFTAGSFFRVVKSARQEIRLRSFSSWIFPELSDTVLLILLRPRETPGWVERCRLDATPSGVIEATRRTSKRGNTYSSTPKEA